MSGCQTTQRLLFFAQHQLSAFCLKSDASEDKKSLRKKPRSW